jgi:regulator of ribonuclease activity A
MSNQKYSTPKIATSDICDAMDDAAHIVDLAFHTYGGCTDFSGPALTLKTDNDNSEVKTLLKSPGEGRVLVIDNGGQMNRAMVGGNLAKWGVENGWAAIVVIGCVRDRHELIKQDIAVIALGCCPKKSDKGSAQSQYSDVTIGTITIKTGMWVTGDLDGLIVTMGKPKT